MNAIERVVASVRQLQPDLVDRWELMAAIESAGYSDRRIQEEFGFADVRALAAEVYDRLRNAAVTSRLKPAPTTEPAPTIEAASTTGPVVGAGFSRLINALASFGANFSNSIVYAVPWMVMFWIEHVRPSAFAMPAQLTAPLMLALMASLVGAGGFVQGIARKGVFFSALGQRAVAQRVTRRLFECGILVTILVAVVALAAGWYFQLFPIPVLLLAVAFYLTLSLLWMVCSLITYEGRRWRIPVVFLVAGLAFVPVQQTALGTVGAQMTAAYAALLAGGVFAVIDRLRCRDALPAFLPDTRVLVHSLAPYFWYGMLYFSLLFADRVVAATVRLLKGGGFSIDLAYAHATDVALVSFLIMAAVVEHLNWLFMKFLREEMRRRAPDDAALRRNLMTRHLLFLVIIVVCFPVIDTLCRMVSVSLRPLALGAGGWRVLVIASTGYLFLCVGLLNSLILLSLNRPFTVVSAFAMALIVNLVCGSILAALLGIPFAAVGLAAGAALLAIYTTGKVASVLAAPAHAYCAS